MIILKQLRELSKKKISLIRDHGEPRTNAKDK
jgi:hypothetical protein